MSTATQITAAGILQELIPVCHSAENRRFLEWESFWYGERATGAPYADDLKRETLPLKLPSTAEEIATISKALLHRGIETRVSDHELNIVFPSPSREPQTLVFSQKNFRWLPESVEVAGDDLLLPATLSLREVLQVAIVLARFPQLTVTQTPVAEIADLPQSFRRHIFRHIILGRKPSHALRFLDAAGLLDHFLPEVTAGRGLAQNRFHAYDIFEHLLRAVDGAYDLNEPVRWSALLHDVGKVPTRVETDNGEATFHNHEMYSARMVVPIMKRLAVPIGIGQKVKFLVRNHMFHYTDEWSDKAVRRFVKKVPMEELQDLISLRLADRKGSGKKSAFPKALQKLIGHIDEIIAKEKEFKIKDLAVDGHTLMEMGMPPSKAMGDLLKFLFEEVKAGRAENTVESLNKLVQMKLQPGRK